MVTWKLIWNRNHPKRNFTLPVSCTMFFFFYFTLDSTSASYASLWQKPCNPPSCGKASHSGWSGFWSSKQGGLRSQARQMLFMKEVTLWRQMFNAWEFNEFLVVLCFLQARNTPLQRSFPSAGRMTKRTRVPAPPVYIEPCAGRAHQGVRWLHVLGALFLLTGWIPWKTARCDFPLQCSAAGAKKCVEFLAEKASEI